MYVCCIELKQQAMKKGIDGNITVTTIMVMMMMMDGTWTIGKYYNILLYDESAIVSMHVTYVQAVATSMAQII